MHAERAVADLKDLFAKKEAEIRELRKEVEAGHQRVQLAHVSIQRQREQTEIYRSVLATLTARVAGLTQTVQTNRREEAEETKLIEGQVEELRALEAKLQEITNKQIEHDFKYIDTYTKMNTQQQNERSQVLRSLGIVSETEADED